MKYRPRELKENVNVTPGHPLKDFLKLLAWIGGSLVVLYLVLGLVVTLVAPHISPGVEKAMGRLFGDYYAVLEMQEKSSELQKIMEGFKPYLSEDDGRLDYRVCVIMNPQVNAIAVPGGTVVVFNGLLKKVDSQKEIAFVLAHELGHFHHRDHLKGMGRALVALVISVTILGENSAATRFIFNTISQVEMKFSRSQEKAADLYAVELLKKRYGSAEGALAFMKKLVAEEKRGKLLYYFSSHPHPSDRLEYIQKTLQDY
jgi:Zn-dependent protease with chaperone function